MTDQKSLIPKRRFAGFTNAWERRKLGEVAESFEYGLNASATEFDGENKYLRITDIDDETHEFKTDSLTSPDVDFTTADNYRLQEGDVLFARTGASVGKTYRYKDFDGIVYFAGFLIRARIKPQYDSEFVFQHTLTDSYNRFIKITSQRSGQPGVNAQEYSDFVISVSKFDEQRKIGLFFENLDHLITLHQRKLDKTRALKSAYLSEMFPAEGETKPKRRFLGFTDAWEQRKLGEVVDVRSGRDYKHLSGGDIPVYGTGGYMLSVNEALSYSEDSVGIGRKGTIDKPYLLRAPFWTVDTLFYAVPKEKYDLDFTHVLFQIIDWKQKDESTGVPSLSKTTINAVDVLTPEIEEQQQIGMFFAEIDHLITLHQRKLEKLQNIKKAYLNEMFV